MKLKETETKQFYELWLPFLDYVNEKYVHTKCQHFYNAEPESVDPQDVYDVSRYIYSHKSVIDEYIYIHSNFTEEEKEIIKGWKKAIEGRFIVERHLKKGSIFIDEENRVYQVCGLYDEIEDLMPFPAPNLIVGALLPFKGRIIVDGLLQAYPMTIGSHMKKRIKDIYIKAKNKHTIITSL